MCNSIIKTQQTLCIYVHFQALKLGNSFHGTEHSRSKITKHYEPTLELTLEIVHNKIKNNKPVSGDVCNRILLPYELYSRTAAPI